LATGSSPTVDNGGRDRSDRTSSIDFKDVHVELGVAALLEKLDERDDAEVDVFEPRTFCCGP
jgi:hypothetical protein